MIPITEDEIARGPRIPALMQCQVVQQIQSANIRLVDSAVPEAMRFEIARIAYVAQSSMPKFKTGYDGTVTEDDQRLYVLTTGPRAVGFVLTLLQCRFWSVEWANDGAVRLHSDEAIHKRCPAIARVWVASNKRKAGLGLALAGATLRHLHIGASVVGWEYPFTEPGSALVRRLCPKQFLVCCDRMTLSKNTVSK